MSRWVVERPLALTGLIGRPPQVFGALRLVPLVRERPAEDLRLAIRRHRQDVTEVDLGRTTYLSYVPHALVARWREDGEPVASVGAQLFHPTRPQEVFGFRVQRLHRLAKREGGNTLRFLPLHLAMEYLLALCFGGPDTAWPEWSRRALREGLSPRVERTAPGSSVRGLESALRQFEIHPGQVGQALFAADVLASVFVVPHPEDYRRLHPALLQDFYGELIAVYAQGHEAVGELGPASAPWSEARDLGGLALALDRVRAEWEAANHLLLQDVLGRPIRGERVARLGAMALERFVTDLNPGADAHLGESIVRQDGEVLYLKTLRLSRPQTKRAYLLQQLAAQGWHLDQTAAQLGATRAQLIARLIRADLGWMLHPSLRGEAG